MVLYKVSVQKDEEGIQAMCQGFPHTISQYAPGMKNYFTAAFKSIDLGHPKRAFYVCFHGNHSGNNDSFIEPVSQVLSTYAGEPSRFVLTGHNSFANSFAVSIAMNLLTRLPCPPADLLCLTFGPPLTATEEISIKKFGKHFYHINTQNDSILKLMDIVSALCTTSDRNSMSESKARQMCTLLGTIAMKS